PDFPGIITSDNTRSGGRWNISASACEASGTATTSYPREDSRSCIRFIVLGLSSTTRIRGRRRRSERSLAPGPSGCSGYRVETFRDDSIADDRKTAFYPEESS